MSNRFDREFPHTAWQPVPPPIGPDGIQHYVDRGRRLRAQAMRRALLSVAAGLLTMARGVAGLVLGGGVPARQGHRLARVPLTARRR